MECIFCKISRGEVKPAAVLFESDQAIAFLDIQPRAPGHALVIPKVHAATLADLDVSFVGPLFEAVQELTRKMKSALSTDSCSIGINDGAGAGQEVAHLHVHIMPRFAGDGGRPVQALVSNPPREPSEDIAEKILKA